MTKPNRPTTLEELLEEWATEYYPYIEIDGFVDFEYKEINNFIKKVYEAGHYEGYRQGIADEIECVETAGEHADLRKLLKQNQHETK